MGKKLTTLVLACALALSTLAACQSPAATTPTAKASTRATVVPTATAQKTAGNQSAGAGTAATPAATAVAPGEYTWDGAEAVGIVLNGNSITVKGSGVTVDGSKATITSAGTYVISGSLTNGQILVDAGGKAKVTLVLNGANIHSSTSAPICIMNDDETSVILADNTDNYLSDAESYILPDPTDDEPNAALFSKDDLTIAGGGSLTVDANYNDGIASKDSLVIAGGTITIGSVDDGIRGKDSLLVQGGNITVNAKGDGLKADNEDDATKGTISVESGVIRITCGGDALQAVTNITITDGEFHLTTGGGSNARIMDSSISTKGIKAGVALRIDDGNFGINSADDALHSNGSLTINGGTFTVSTGDDAIHADGTLELNGGQLTILDSYEGLESSVITINDGDIHINSSDDGINAVAGNDSSGTTLPPGQSTRPGRGGGPGQDRFVESGNNSLHIHGGYVFIDANGDGLDINGTVEMTNGIVIVNGPTSNMNGALDHTGFKLTGGYLLAVGSAGMAQAPDTSSTQYSVLLNFNGSVPADVLFHVQSSDGKPIFTFSSTKRFQSVVFSTAELKNGTTYDVYYQGSSTGMVTDGLYQGGTYTPGTQYTSFTVSGVVTTVGGVRR